MLGALLVSIVLLLPGTPTQERFARLGLPAGNLTRGLDEHDVVLASAEWADYVHLVSDAPIVVDARLERFRASDLRGYLRFRDEADLTLARRTDATAVLLHDQTRGNGWPSGSADVTANGVTLHHERHADNGDAYRVG